MTKEDLHKFEIVILNQLLTKPMTVSELVKKTGLTEDQVKRTEEWLRLKNRIKQGDITHD